MPKVIKLNDKKYYNSFDIIDENKELFASCKKYKRRIIKRMNLRDTDYVYAYYNNTRKR